MRAMPGLLAMALLTACGGSTPAPAPRGLDHEAVAAGVVEILVDGRLAASGWIADADGFVVTLASRVEGATQVEVQSPLMPRVRAVVAATDPLHDVALLRVPGLGDARPLRIARDPAAAGQKLWLFGAVFPGEPFVFAGVRARGPDDVLFSFEMGSYMDGLYVSGSVPPGAAGGPWVDATGAVVGTQASAVFAGDTPVPMMFATRAAPLAQLVKTRQAPAAATLRVYLGEWRTRGVAEIESASGAEGLAIVDFGSESPAFAAGMHVGDRIVSLDGRRVRSTDEFVRSIWRREPGAKVTLEIVGRDGETRSIVALLASTNAR